MVSARVPSHFKRSLRFGCRQDQGLALGHPGLCPPRPFRERPTHVLKMEAVSPQSMRTLLPEYTASYIEMQQVFQGLVPQGALVTETNFSCVLVR